MAGAPSYTHDVYSYPFIIDSIESLNNYYCYCFSILIFSVQRGGRKYKNLPCQQALHILPSVHLLEQGAFLDF